MERDTENLSAFGVVATVPAIPAKPQARVNRRREHLFFTGMASAMTIVVVIGFARSFFLSFLWAAHDPHASSEPAYYIHGALAAAWMALSVIQPLLIARRRVKWHRQVGSLGAALAGSV